MVIAIVQVVAPGDAGIRSRSDVLLVMDLHALVRDFAVYLAAAPSKYLILRVQQHEKRSDRPFCISPWYIRGLFSLVSRIWTMVDPESDDRINAQSEHRQIPMGDRKRCKYHRIVAK